jgi:YVTN family beta-propeller protein
MRPSLFIKLLMATILIASAVHATHFAYINNFVTNTVAIIDTIQNKVIAQINDPNDTFDRVYFVAITPDGKKAYVANQGTPPRTSSISIVDVATNTVTGLVKDPQTTFNGIYSISISPDGSKMYVLNGGNDTISIVNIATDTVTGLVKDHQHIQNNAGLIVFTPDGTKAYEPNHNSSTVGIIDVATDTIIGTINDPTHIFQGPIFSAITPDSTTLYVANYDAPTLVRVDVATDAILGLVNDPGHTFDHMYYVAITPNGKTAYIDNYPSNAPGAITISVVDIASNSVTDVISNPGFREIFYLAITSDGKKMFGPNYGAASVSVFDLTNNTVTGTVNDTLLAFDGPYSIALFPAPQSPRNVTSNASANVFLLETDLINVIEWRVPISGPPTKYAIYRNPELTDLAGEVPSGCPLRFLDHNRKPGTTYTYYLVAVNQYGDASQPVIVTIRACC